MTKDLEAKRESYIIESGEKKEQRTLFSLLASWYPLTILLAATAAISIFVIPENVSPLVYLRSALAVIFIMFLPGYSFVKALFPDNGPIKSIPNRDKGESTLSNEKNLSETFRLAIEKSFGMQIPLPTSSERIYLLERVGLSLGMSLTLTSMVGLILNYTPWGVRLIPVTLTLLAFTVVFATVGMFRESTQVITRPKQEVEVTFTQDVT